mmetsp:Transcript_30058/g.82542  ORF Transcript_30058/g.82542 Transcript_30058/m.82542 type:complete len:294 (+) Transcript_30058:134-1015(+)
MDNQRAIQFLALCLAVQTAGVAGFAQCSTTASTTTASSGALHMSSIAGNAFDPHAKRTLYHILGADPTETHAELKRKYRQLARQCHPDMLRLQANPHMELDFREVAAAWNTLGDQKERKRYDRTLFAEQVSENLFGWIDGLADTFFGGDHGVPTHKDFTQRRPTKQPQSTSAQHSSTTVVSTTTSDSVDKSRFSATTSKERQQLHLQRITTRESTRSRQNKHHQPFHSCTSGDYRRPTSSQQRSHHTNSMAQGRVRTLQCQDTRKSSSYILTKEEHTYDQYIEVIQQQQDHQR